MRDRAWTLRAFFLLAAALLAAERAPAGEPAEPARPAGPAAHGLRIRVVDIQRIIERSEKREEGLAAIKKRYRPQSDDLEKEAKRLRDEAAGLRASPLDRKGFAYRERALKLDLMKLAYEKKVQKYLREVEGAQLQLKEDVLKEVLAAIRDYARANEIDIVLQKVALLPPREVRAIGKKGIIGEVPDSPLALAVYASEAADITDAVTEVVNGVPLPRASPPASEVGENE